MAGRNLGCDESGAAVFEWTVLGIRKVVNLLRLPGPQTFQQEFVYFGCRCQLRGEDCRVASSVKGFRSQNAGRLVVAVVLTNEKAGQPRNDDLGPGEPH